MKSWITIHHLWLEPRCLYVCMSQASPPQLLLKVSLTRKFASVTLRVIRDRVVFSDCASSRFASSKCFRAGDAKTRRRESIRVCPALYIGSVFFSKKLRWRALFFQINQTNIKSAAALWTLMQKIGKKLTWRRQRGGGWQFFVSTIMHN